MRFLPLLITSALLTGSPAFADDDKWGDPKLAEAIEEAGNQSEDLAKQIKKAPPEKKADLEDKRDAQLDRIDEIADKKPDSIRIQRKAAETFLKVNEPERAILRADRLVRLAPNDHKAVWLRGQTFFKLGDYHSAEKDARRALALNPNDRRAFGLLKLTEGRDGPANTPPPDPNRKPSREQAAAVAYLDFAGATKTARNRKVMKLIKKANRKIALGDFAEAADIAEKAVKLAPKDPQAHLLLAKAKLETGDAKGAEASAYTVLTLDPGNAAGHLILAQAEEALGASEEDVLALYLTDAGFQHKLN